MAKWPSSVSPAKSDVSELLGHLSDDLNTPAFVQHLQRMTSDDPARFAAVAGLIGVSKAEAKVRELSATEKDAVETQVSARLGLIAEKNWAEADRIRDELLEQGIQLKDGKNPETGDRVTTWEVKR